METQNLKAFLLVAESRSFSRAAEKLHLTQPAVSKRVALLEQFLDTELFDRIGRSVSLTESGRALLPHAKAVEQQLREASRAVKDLSGDVAGELRLATSHHIGLHRLPGVLSEFNTLYPDVRLDIDFMDSEQAYEQIMQARVELAVVTLAPTSEANLVSVPVWQDPLEFMVAPDHPLNRERHVSLATLSRYAAILPGLNTYTGQIVKGLFDAQKVDLRVSMATNYLETIRMMASVGLGWTILPSSMRDNSLTALAIKDVHIERNLGRVHHRGRSLSRAAQAFIALLERFSDLPLAAT